MKNTYYITVTPPNRPPVRAYVAARRVTRAVRLVLESEKCRFSAVRSIQRIA